MGHHQLGEILRLELQARTIFQLLKEKMDGVDRITRRKSLKERLGLNSIACCGANWGLGPTTVSVRDDDEQEEEGPIGPLVEVTNDAASPPCVGQSPATAGMNLAAALAAERQFRASIDSADVGGPAHVGSPNTSPLAGTARVGPGTPLRMSLMRLLEETDGWDGVIMMKKEEEASGCSDSVCCVCMGRKKGAALIPCGHTFCRVCSREVWLNRGTCPLCNRTILEILDIY